MKPDLKSRLARALNDIFDLRDYFAFIGLACACYGVAQVFPPAAWALAGAAFWWLGVRR